MQQLVELIQRNVRLSNIAVSNMQGQRSALLVLGVLVALFGFFFVWIALQRDRPVWVLLVLGVLITAYAVYLIVRSYRFKTLRT